MPEENNNQANIMVRDTWFETIEHLDFKAIFICPDGSFIDVTDIIKDLFDPSTGSLTRQVTWRDFPFDPCIGLQKCLIVWYKDANGNKKTAVFKETGDRRILGRQPNLVLDGWVWPDCDKIIV